MTNRITAVFHNQTQAQEAVQELRTLGVHEADLSFIARQDQDRVVSGDGADFHDEGKGAARGLAVGASAGALFGLAAALIPGVGPFITAGFLATSLGAAAGGAAAGAIVGGVTGTIAGALSEAGYDRHEAEYYEQALNQGGVLVAIEPPAHVTRDQIVQVVERHQGTVQGWSGDASNARASLGTYSDTDTTRTTGFVDTDTTRTTGYVDTDTHLQGQRTGAVREDLDDAARLQLREERLEVEKERFVAGSVEVGKRVETHAEQVDVELQREEIVIERHPVSGQVLEGDVRLGADQQSIRVDLEAERANVEKRAFVTEEVEVGKRTEVERETFTETVGKEVLEVNRTGNVDVRADQTATGTLRDSTQDIETELERKQRLEREQNNLSDDTNQRR